MRVLAGFVAFNALLLVVGLALLFAVGLVRPRVRDLPWALGAALLAGAAAIGVAGSAVLVAGGTLALPSFVAGTLVASALLAAVGLARARRSAEQDEREPSAPAGHRLDRVALAIVVGALGLFLVVEAVSSRHLAPGWDAAHNWTLKALALSTGGMDGNVFTGRGTFSGAHLDYPILHPVLGGLLFRFAARGQQGLIAAEMWLLCGALALAAPFLTRPRARTWLAIAPFAMVLGMSTSLGVLRGDADVTVAIFLAGGALALAAWIDRGETGLAILATLLLGAAVNVKNEGSAFAAAIVAAAALGLLLTRPRRLPALLAVAAGVALLVAPWRLWVAAHGPFVGDVTPLSTSLDWTFLSARFYVLDFAGRTVLNHLLSSWLVPVFLAVAIAALFARRDRGIAAFYACGVVVCVLALLWVYWTTLQPDWSGHIQRTAERTVTGPLFLAAAGLAHLLPRGLTWRSP